MKLLILFATICVLSLGAATMRELPQKPASFGAPVSSTGAPGERTCAAAGCHDTYPPNGRGAMTISVAGAENGFKPGMTYDVAVRVADNNARRFGFQIVALNDDNSNAGTLMLTDSARTQIISNDLTLQDRQYATYTYAGTEQFAAGVGYWTLKWTAPAAAKNVTFYAATVIANDDNTDYGDYTLTASLPVAPQSPAGGVEGGQTITELPFITSDGLLRCAFNLSKSDEISVELSDITGRVYPLGKRSIGAGIQTAEFPVPAGAKGINFVRLTTSAGRKSYPIFFDGSGR